MWASERDNERVCATTLTHLHYTITQTHTVCACLNTSMSLHTSTNRYTNKHWPVYVNGNVSELVCTTHTSGVSSISNPCETVDYSCKFSCLHTAFAMSFYLPQLNVNHYFVYSWFQRNNCELFSSTQSCRLGFGRQLDLRRDLKTLLTGYVSTDSVTIWLNFLLLQVLAKEL